MNTCEKIRINRRDRRCTDLLTPRRSPNSALLLHTEAVHCQSVLLESSILLSDQ